MAELKSELLFEIRVTKSEEVRGDLGRGGACVRTETAERYKEQGKILDTPGCTTHDAGFLQVLRALCSS